MLRKEFTNNLFIFHCEDLSLAGTGANFIEGTFISSVSICTLSSLSTTFFFLRCWLSAHLTAPSSYFETDYLLSSLFFPVSTASLLYRPFSPQPPSSFSSSLEVSSHLYAGRYWSPSQNVPKLYSLNAFFWIAHLTNPHYGFCLYCFHSLVPDVPKVW